ncbi:pyruvate dehydrogenase protein X component, mitochondrial-like [Centruroides vittatus]|uniref:pyruvate dehydrogenase protein X component, mitochondrial-like n=1 Tax=Centruroides vittatus TaxID=120091 RepID=UPI00350F7DAD
MMSSILGRNFLRISNALSSANFFNRVTNAYLHRSHVIFGVKGIEIKMPSLSPTMTEGTIIKWLKKEGETISPGDILCEIQTDKAVVALELEEEGILAKILIPEDTKDIKIGTVIGLMVEEGQDWKDVEIPTITETPIQEKVSSQERLQETPKKVQKTRMMGPAVKTLLEKYKINPDEVSSTGPHEVLLKVDVMNYISKYQIKEKPIEVIAEKSLSTPSIPSITPTDISDYIDIPHTNMRRTIAKRLTESKTTIPHSYMSICSCVDEVIQFRKELKNDGIDVSLNDFVIKAVASALHSVPEVNVMWMGDRIQQLSTIDISVAVATKNGLITPIVKDADMLGIQEISRSIRELASKAREGKLQPHEFQGGTFSVSNLGMYGITEFTAVINPPQSSILAVGTLQSKPDENGKVKTVVTGTLSFDGRAVDETSAARFLKAFQDNLENPVNMILGAKQSSEVIN